MNHLGFKFLAVSVIFAILSGVIFRSIISNAETNIAIRCIGLFIAVLKLVISALLCILAYLPISKLHTPKTALMHYVLYISISVIGYFALKRINRNAKNLRQTQEDVLMKMLAKFAGTRQGRDKSLSSIHSTEEFRSEMPLTTYEDYRSYVERIENGEDNVLTPENVLKLSTSSGTTGKVKLVPFVGTMNKIFALDFFFPMMYGLFHKKRFPGNWAPLKTFEISYVPKWRYSNSGIPIGPLSGHHGTKPFYMTVPYTTPSEVAVNQSEPAQSYVHWLIALRDDQVKRIFCGFGGALLVNFEFFERNWKQLVDDIRHGTVTNTHDIRADVVESLKKLHFMKPDPERADKLEKECLKGFNGIVKRIWPNMHACMAICTGAHSIYRERLIYYIGQGISLISPVIGASEGPFAMPMNEEQSESYSYTFMPRAQFVEFIPEEQVTSDNPTCLLMDELEVGKRYETVVTSHAGFLRYRMGDVFKVVDKYNQVPVVEFVSRTGGIIDLRGEKVAEDEMSVAVHETALQWQGCRGLLEYTITDSVTLERTLGSTTGLLYYVIFVELDGIERSLTSSEVATFDEILGKRTAFYRGYRNAGSISDPKVYVVKHGTFERFKRYILEANQAVSNQYKTPRYVKRDDHVKLLVDSSFTA